MPRRLALLIATNSYEDPGLRRLTSPAADVEALAAVLGDPAVAGFEVTTLVDEPHHRVGAAIGDLLRDRRRNDLTLLYFTGHGVKDDAGRLHLATADTRRDNLLFSAVSAEQVDAAMSACMSRRQLLILDCCYSGAFPAGRGAKADAEVHTLERFRGRGRTVLTATDSTQYAFEGEQLRGAASTSVFTRHLVAGLRDGSADLDRDGDITVDELYTYVHDKVVEEMPQQRPKRQDDVEGRLVVARNVRWTLPAYLADGIASPLAAHRLSALDGLAHLHRIGNPVVRAAVRAEYERLADDDSRSVSAAARARLAALDPPPPPAAAPAVAVDPAPDPTVDPAPAPAVPAPTPTVDPAPTPAVDPAPAPAVDPAQVPPVDPAPTPTVGTPTAVDPPAVAGSTVVEPPAAEPGPGGPEPVEPGPGEARPAEPRAGEPTALGPGAGEAGAVGPSAREAGAGGRPWWRTRRAGVAAAIVLVLLAAGIPVGFALSDRDRDRGGTSGGGATAGQLPVRRAALGPDGALLYVTTASGIAVLDTTTGSFSGSIALTAGAQDVAVDPTGTRLYVGSGSGVAVVDLRSRRTVSNPVATAYPGVASLALAPDGKRLYVALPAQDAVSVVDTRSNTVVGQVPTRGDPTALAISSDSRRLYVADGNWVSAVDTATLRPVGSPVQVIQQPVALALSPTDDRLYVGGRAGGLAVLRADATGVTSELVTLLVPAVTALLVRPDGRRLWAADGATGAVLAFDVPQPKAVPGTPADVEGPGALVPSPDGKRLYVPSFTSGQVFVLDAATGKLTGTPIPTS